VCKKQFTRQSSVIRHQQVHGGGERQFSGNVYNKFSGEASTDK
jgi:hypothetical protein